MSYWLRCLLSLPGTGLPDSANRHTLATSLTHFRGILPVPSIYLRHVEAWCGPSMVAVCAGRSEWRTGLRPFRPGRFAWTNQGVRNAKESTTRIRQASEALRSLGVTLQTI